MYSHFIDVYIW